MTLTFPQFTTNSMISSAILNRPLTGASGKWSYSTTTLGGGRLARLPVCVRVRFIVKPIPSGCTSSYIKYITLRPCQNFPWRLRSIHTERKAKSSNNKWWRSKNKLQTSKKKFAFLVRFRLVWALLNGFNHIVGIASTSTDLKIILLWFSMIKSFIRVWTENTDWSLIFFS